MLMLPVQMPAAVQIGLNSRSVWLVSYYDWQEQGQELPGSRELRSIAAGVGVGGGNGWTRQNTGIAPAAAPVGVRETFIVHPLIFRI
jgi:hypothetical protein